MDEALSWEKMLLYPRPTWVLSDFNWMDVKSDNHMGRLCEHCGVVRRTLNVFPMFRCISYSKVSIHCKKSGDTAQKYFTTAETINSFLSCRLSGEKNPNIDLFSQTWGFAALLSSTLIFLGFWIVFPELSTPVVSTQVSFVSMTWWLKNRYLLIKWKIPRCGLGLNFGTKELRKDLDAVWMGNISAYLVKKTFAASDWRVSHHSHRHIFCEIHFPLKRTLNELKRSQRTHIDTN